MKRLVLVAILSIVSLSAFAQFPLGASKDEIKSFFDENVSYANIQEYKTKDGGDALNFAKVRIVGDYTFYFNDQDVCTSYIETYDKDQTDEVIWRFDRKFCRLTSNTWGAEDESFSVTMIKNPKKGANYISIVYSPVVKPDDQPASALASN
jgi:hypothetical protein